jgi:HTH-type transcriptional regulator/antitoxin HigA
MNITAIHFENDYQNDLKRIELLMDSSLGASNGDELEILSILVDAYEKKVFPIKNPDPIEALKFRMEQSGFSNTDIAHILHSTRGRVSEILNKKRALTLNMIRRLSKEMQIPAELLIQDYS